MLGGGPGPDGVPESGDEADGEGAGDDGEPEGDGESEGDGDGEGEGTGGGEQDGDGTEVSPQTTRTVSAPGQICTTADPGSPDRTVTSSPARCPPASVPPAAPSASCPEDARADQLTGPRCAAMTMVPLLFGASSSTAG